MPVGVQARVLQVWRLLQAVEAERQALRRAERQRAVAGRAETPTLVQRLVATARRGRAECDGVK